MSNHCFEPDDDAASDSPLLADPFRRRLLSAAALSAASGVLAAHDVSVIEVRQDKGAWQVVRPSSWARRVTADTPCRVAGPAAAHPAMQTAADHRGEVVLGTLNNCAMGVTPWGTYLTCEENFNGYFKAPQTPNTDQKRYGISEKGAGFR